MLYQDFSDSRSARSAFLTGARAFGLHALGALAAILLLIAGVGATSRYFPHVRIWNEITTALGFLSDDEPTVPSRPQVASAPVPVPPVQPVVVRRTRARSMPMPPARTRFFVPPPPPAAPSPQFVDESPTVEPLVLEPVVFASTDFVLPPRPKNAIVKVLTALSFPFRFIGGIFVRDEDDGREDEDADQE